MSLDPDFMQYGILAIYFRSDDLDYTSSKLF